MNEILIKNMELPRTVTIYPNGDIDELVDGKYVTIGKAIELEPHGRLVDADKGLEFYADVLIKNFPATQKSTIDEMILGMKKMLDALPTVLEAST